MICRIRKIIGYSLITVFALAIVGTYVYTLIVDPALFLVAVGGAVALFAFLLTAFWLIDCD